MLTNGSMLVNGGRPLRVSKLHGTHDQEHCYLAMVVVKMEIFSERGTVEQRVSSRVGGSLDRKQKQSEYR